MGQSERVAALYSSSVKLGDERKTGVERSWESEYGAEFSVNRLHAPSVSPEHEFFNTPRSIKSQLSFADHARVLPLEKKLGQRVKERSRHSTTAIRRAFKLMDKHDQGSVSVPEFVEFLRTWHIDCTQDDIQELLHKYSTGNGRIDYNQFLASALPRDFFPV